MGYFGGIHGLQRISAEVVLAYRPSLVMRLQWDSTLHQPLDDGPWVLEHMLGWANTLEVSGNIDTWSQTSISPVDGMAALVTHESRSACFGAALEVGNAAVQMLVTDCSQVAPSAI